MKSPDGAANTPGDGQPAQVADVGIVAEDGRLRFGVNGRFCLSMLAMVKYQFCP